MQGWTVGGMAKGAGMLAPGLATMLVVLTTDAVADAATLDAALRAATRVTFDRIDSDGCMSTNDTVLLLASGASGVVPDPDEFAQRSPQSARPRPSADRATPRAPRRTSGSTWSEPPPRTRPSQRPGRCRAATCSSARSTARTRTGAGSSRRSAPPTSCSSPTRSTWPSTESRSAATEPASATATRWTCRGARSRSASTCAPDAASATLWTNDLTAMYVHENSAYST